MKSGYNALHWLCIFIMHKVIMSTCSYFFWTATPHKQWPIEYRGYLFIHPFIHPYVSTPDLPVRDPRRQSQVKRSEPQAQSSQASKYNKRTNKWTNRWTYVQTDVRTYACTDIRTEGRTDGRTNYPLYSTGHCPSGAAALLTIGISEGKKKQGKGTADHILTLVD